MAVAERVVYDGTCYLRGFFGHADEVEDRKIFGISACHARERAEFAHAVGGADGPDAFDASVAVRCVGGVEFVAAADPAELWIETNGVVDGKRKITGNTKDVADTDLFETAKNIFNDGLGQAGLLGVGG